MGKIYDLIKKELDEIKNYSLLEREDLIQARLFPNYIKTYKNLQKINSVLESINYNCAKYFGSKENYNQFLKDNDSLLKKKPIYEGDFMTFIPFVERGNDHCIRPISDYETLLNNIEEKIGNEKVDELISDYEKSAQVIPQTRSNPLTKYINTIKGDVETLYPELSKEEQTEIISNLDYVNDMIIEKKLTGPYEDIVEISSTSRFYKAKDAINQYAEKNEIEPNKLNEYVVESNLINIQFDDIEGVEMTKNSVFNNPDNKVSDELKEKLVELDKYITEIGIPSKFIANEQGNKQYGLIDYFEKTEEISNLIGTYSEKTDSNDKKAIINSLNLKSKELKEIEQKYDDIFKKISNMFDLNKVSLSGNLYNGRGVTFVPENIKYFSSNLPEKWDNENAPWNVILSGFCQLKGAALRAGVSVEEYINHPVGYYLKSAFKTSDDRFNKAYIPRENNSLGKRIAHALVMNPDIGAEFKRDVAIENRGIEFLTVIEDYNENTLDKVISNNIGINYFIKFDQSANNLWLDEENNPVYNNLKNIFAMADKTDKLYELSDHFYDANMNKGPKYSYNDSIKDLDNTKPLFNEKNNVLGAIKDYIAEKTRMMNNIEEEGGVLKVYLADENIIHAGKEYFNDFILANNKNIFDLSKNERKQVLNFINDPVDAFAKKYKKQLHLSNDYINELKQDYKAENDRLNAPNAQRFIDAFNRNNNFEGNRGKNLDQIFNDNAGGWLEWLGQTTSKEYLALKDAVNAATKPESPVYGDYRNSKYFAQKYIEHKLPDGVKFEDLKANEKRRVEFCRSIIAAVDELEKPTVNLENQNINNNIIENNIVENEDFQNKVNKDVELNKEEINENIIDTSSKQIENNKEIEQ